MKKMIFLLNIDKYAPEITALTYPLIYYWAKKIGADVHQIRERKFKDWPNVYEKLQIYQLAKEMKNDWNIYIDSDALVSPDTIDFTEFLPRGFVAHNGSDFANIRWKYDKYFQRDGRNIGSCNWFAIASDLCLDLWRPLDDMTCDEALANIYPTIHEENSKVINKRHLIDDYVLSRNIAKFGLHFTTITQLCMDLKIGGGFEHVYVHHNNEKIKILKNVLEQQWKVPKFVRDFKYVS